MLDGVEVMIDMTKPMTQILKISMKFKPDNHFQEILLPAWTPGSYKIRDHAQFLYGLVAKQNSEKLTITRVGVSKWTLSLIDLANIELTYYIEARASSVRTSYIDDQYATLTLSNIILLVNEKRHSHHNLELVLPEGWKSYISLDRNGICYEALNYDQIVDAPLFAGDFSVKTLYVKECEHKILCIGQPPKGWPINLISDIESICESACQIMDESPPSGNRYLFIIEILEKAYGGLEHDNSTFIQFDWRTLYQDNGYRRLLRLIGHEYFHQWNIRRLRPKEYISYDYNSSVISESLWFAEGITSYFDLLLPMLSGNSSPDLYLEDLSFEISKALDTPGRYIQSISDSSKEAWIKLYNSTSASVDTQVSYYRFGILLSLCLDVYLRKVGSSLPMFLRLIWRKFSSTGDGYTRSELKLELQKIEESLPDKLDLWLDEPDSLPLNSVLSDLGLLLTQTNTNLVDTGMSIVEDADCFFINRIAYQSPGFFADVSIGDQIIAINNFRITNLSDFNDFFTPDEKALLTYFRKGRLFNCYITPRMVKEPTWNLVVDKNSSDDASHLRKEWLKVI